jgi:hypothetical protein
MDIAFPETQEYNVFMNQNSKIKGILCEPSLILTCLLYLLQSSRRLQTFRRIVSSSPACGCFVRVRASGIDTWHSSAQNCRIWSVCGRYSPSRCLIPFLHELTIMPGHLVLLLMRYLYESKVLPLPAAIMLFSVGPLPFYHLTNLLSDSA